MDARQRQTPEAIAQILELRIKGLDREELDARNRSDWSAASNIVLKRAPLKETSQRTAVPGRNRT